VIDRLIELLDVTVPEGGTARFELGNLPRGDSGLLAVGCAVGLVMLTLWLYRREGAASRWRKAGLAGLRLLAYACVLFVLLEPRLAIDIERTVEGHTVVLWDTSLSMDIPDKYRDPELAAAMAEAAGIDDPDLLKAERRADLAWRIVARADLLPGLAERNKLLVYAFDAEPRRLGESPQADPRSLPEELTPQGPATDLAMAVRKALEETGGRTVAAMVVVTDGGLNKGEGEQGVIAALERRGIPFYAIGIGDPTPPKNLAVVELSAEERVVLGDPMVIEGAVQGRGYAGQTVDVELTVEPAAGGEPTLLERRPVVFPEADDEKVPLTFRHAPAEKGDYVFRLRLPEREEEPRTDDNEEARTVTVTDDKTRVLIIAGSPSFEYHFLKQRLIREKTAVLSCWLQSADPRFPQDGNEPIEAMPTTQDELQAFDLVMLLDPNPEGFDAVVAETYKSFVADYKGGLLFLPGPTYAAELFQRPDLKPLRDLLPVIPGEALEAKGSANERWPLKATVDGADHPASRLHPDRERSASLWSRLPGMFSSYPVEREKAGATVLVRHEDPATLTERGGRPLLVSHFFDGGPVVWQGAAETWRWRSVGEKVYDRYWVSLLRFLIQGRLAGGRKRLELTTDKEEYVVGEAIRLRAHAYDRGYSPLDVASLDAVVRAGGEETTLELEPVSKRTQPGWYQATFFPPGKGTVEFSMRLPDDDPGAKPATKGVTVALPALEYADPRLDEELLASIASATSGALVAPAEVSALAERIESKEETLVVAGSPILLWDRWATILFVCGLLGIEWTIRKRSRMV
jgi:hypothetical protein